MDNIAQRLKAYIEAHPFDPGDSNCETVLHLPLEDNNAVFNLCCSLCTAYEHKAFQDGLQYGAHLMLELFRKEA